jgi:hypothetical protein
MSELEKKSKTVNIEPFKISTSPFVLEKEKDYVREVYEKPWEKMKILAEQWSRLDTDARLKAWPDIHSKVNSNYVDMYNVSAKMGGKIAKRKRYFTLYLKSEGKIKKKEQSDLSKIVKLFNEAQRAVLESSRLKFIMSPIFLMTEEHIMMSTVEANDSKVSSLAGLIRYRDETLPRTSKDQKVTSDLLKDDNYFSALRKLDGEEEVDKEEV